jgi:hypothetical protein
MTAVAGIIIVLATGPSLQRRGVKTVEAAPAD